MNKLQISLICFHNVFHIFTPLLPRPGGAPDYFLLHCIILLLEPQFFFITCTTLYCNIHIACKPPWSCKQLISIMTNTWLACIITYWFCLAVVRESPKGESKVNWKHNMNASCTSKSVWATCWAVICLIWICTHSLIIQGCSLAVFFAMSVARLVFFFFPFMKTQSHHYIKHLSA